MAKRERVYLKDVALWGEIDHEGSSEQFPETYAKLDSLTQFSHKKLSWKCPKGHFWHAAISNKSRGSGCPFCSGLRVSDTNSLASNRSELAREWDFDKNELSPYDVAAHSNRAAWWKCEVGHTWKATVNNRSNGHGCPFCSGKRVSDTNNLAANKPELAREWDFDKNEMTPFDVTFSSNRKAYWKCAVGHTWKATVNSRSNGHGCPKCAQRTSKIEKRFIKEFTEQTDFTVTAHGMRLGQIKYESGRSGVEVDIILCRNNHYLLLEYDGNYWHRDRVESDMEKSRLLLSLGDNILHARIRENDLPDLDLAHDRFAQFRHDYHRTEPASISKTVREIEHWFQERIGG